MMIEKDKQSPSISVITVTYNAAPVLPRLVDSLRKQMDVDYEWIVVDGASDDNTVELITKTEDIVTKWVSEPDHGIYYAMNKGIDIATGDYVLFVGADDVLYPSSIMQIKSFIEQLDIVPDFVIGAVKVKEKILKGYRPELAWLGPKACVTHHSVGMLVRRKVMNELGGFSMAFHQCADGLLIKKLIKGGYIGIDTDVLMGEFSTEGVSNRNRARGLAEGYLVQLETGESPFLQYLLFLLRLIKNFFRLVKK